jgi:hypothetical protein
MCARPGTEPASRLHDKLQLITTMQARRRRPLAIAQRAVCQYRRLASAHAPSLKRPVRHPVPAPGPLTGCVDDNCRTLYSPDLSQEAGANGPAPALGRFTHASVNGARRRNRMPRRKKTPEPERPPQVADAEVERDIAEDFQERQNLSGQGSQELADKLREHNSLSPELSAGDVDAAWDTARESGEETFTGHAPTPDQDRVDEMGAAAGLTYKDDEPLQYGKVSRRDERRWELEPRSGQAEQTMDEDGDEEEDDEDDAADADDAPLRFWDLADDLDAEVEEEYDDEDDDEEEEDADTEEDEDTLASASEGELVDEADETDDEDLEEEDEAEELLGDDELDSDLDEDLDALDELDDEEEDDDD